MAQPNKKEYPPSNGRGSMMSWRVTNGRVTSGMSMEDLKHQTALRLANEQREDHCGQPTEEYPIMSDRQATVQGYAPPQLQLQALGSQTAAGYPHYSSQLSPGRRQVLQPPPPPPPQQYAYTRYEARYDTALPPPLPHQQQQLYDRNYLDSQLGMSSPGSQPLFSHPPILHSSSSGSVSNSARPNSYSTPRPKNAPLQDRGSAENRSFDGDAAGEAASMNAATAWSNNVGSPFKGARVGSSSSLKKKKGNGKQKERSSLDGRVTPVKEVHVEPQRILYSTPNVRREMSTSTPTSVYSEPQPSCTNKSSNTHNNRSPRQSANNNLLLARSPDFTCGRATAPSNAPFYKHAPQHQSKLPHGLTVQELKEMTRARLAAEANYEADSVHSGGTREEGQQQQQDRTSPREYSLPLPLPQQNINYCASFRKSSTDGISISSVPSNGNLSGYVQQPQPHQPHAHLHQQPHPQHCHQRMQHQPPSMHYPDPRYPSPVYHQQVHNHNSSPVRERSPSFGKPRTDTWETSSAASEYQVPELYAPNAVPSFSSPMTFNRGRCFSAGATITAGVPAPPPSYEALSWEEARPNPPLGTYYDTSLQEANRRRCATMSPPGMSRLHEDRPFLFSGDEKERLAIPPLSEPRPRFHSTGILGSAFEPISSLRSVTAGMHHHQGVVPPSPPSFLERVKFNVGDRMLSTGSNGDLPSSVAEAVLESLHASSGPMDLFDCHSPLRSFSNAEDVGTRKSPFRNSENHSELTYPLDRLVTEESSGNGSLFSSGASKSMFSSQYSNERLLSVTNSWGGEVGLENSSLFRISQDFSNLLNIGNDGPGLRGRAATAPCFVENHPFISQLDPEHHSEEDEKKLVPPFSSYESASSASGISVPGRSSTLPPGFDKPSGSS